MAVVLTAHEVTGLIREAMLRRPMCATITGETGGFTRRWWCAAGIWGRRIAEYADEYSHVYVKHRCTVADHQDKPA